MPTARSTAVVVLSLVVLGLSVVATLTGLLWQGEDGPSETISVRGETTALYGEGLYRHDSEFKGAANRGSDLVTLALAVPLLGLALARYVRGSAAGALGVAAALAWFLYLYASLALGAAYNGLFLVHVAIFSASLYGLIAVLRSVPRAVLQRIVDEGPTTAVSRLMLAGGIVTAVVWLGPLLGALLGDEPPELLGHSSTMVTDALDLAIITPATLLTALLLRRREAEGVVLAVPLLGILVALFPAIVAQTVFQLDAGYSFEPPEIIGPMVGFLVLAAIATPLLVRILRIAAGAGTLTSPG